MLHRNGPTNDLHLPFYTRRRKRQSAVGVGQNSCIIEERESERDARAIYGAVGGWSYSYEVELLRAWWFRGWSLLGKECRVGEVEGSHHAAVDRAFRQLNEAKFDVGRLDCVTITACHDTMVWRATQELHTYVCWWDVVRWGNDHVYRRSCLVPKFDDVAAIAK